MFRRKDAKPAPSAPPVPVERVTSVLGGGTIWKGSLSGSGGVRIEGAFEGEITLRGLLVVGATGRVTCPHLRASVVIVAGALRGDVTAERVEIRSTGRVWGNVVTAAFSTEEGAFLRGQIQMEDKVDIGVNLSEAPAAAPLGEPEGTPEPASAETQETPIKETFVSAAAASEATTPITPPTADEASRENVEEAPKKAGVKRTRKQARTGDSSAAAAPMEDQTED